MNFITGLSFLQSAVCVLACIGAYQGTVSVGELAIVSCILAGTAIISSTISDMGALIVRLLRSKIEIDLDILKKMQEK